MECNDSVVKFMIFHEFLKNTQALRVVEGLHMTGVKRGNCRDGVAEGSNIDIKAPLPKRQRSQKRKEFLVTTIINFIFASQ